MALPIGTSTLCKIENIGEARRDTKAVGQGLPTEVRGMYFWRHDQDAMEKSRTGGAACFHSHQAW